MKQYVRLGIEGKNIQKCWHADQIESTLWAHQWKVASLLELGSFK